MSASRHAANGNPSAANLHLILEEASKKYKRLTGHDLTTHPFAAKLDNWDSVESVLKVFQEQAQVFNQFHKDHRRLIEWLTPTVRTLITASAILGEALSVVGFNHLFLPYHTPPTLFPQPFPPAKGVFVGIGVLLSVGLFPNTLGCDHVTLDLSRRPRMLSQTTTYSLASSSAFNFSFNVSISIPVFDSRPH
jgi:hypothetical protein